MITEYQLKISAEFGDELRRGGYVTVAKKLGRGVADSLVPVINRDFETHGKATSVRVEVTPGDKSFANIEDAVEWVCGELWGDEE